MGPVRGKAGSKRMDPKKQASVVARVAAVAAQFDQALDGQTAGRITTFIDLLLRWNERINLTGAREALEVVQDHLPDSFALSALTPRGARLVDVGTGGGLPALPFALLRPDVALTLVEPRAKRVAFLRAAVRELGLAATVLPARVEDLEGTFEVAASRATFPPQEWWERGSDLLLPQGGRLVFFLSGSDGIPFPSSASHQVVSYLAGAKGRTAVALTVSSKPG
jgi:16S rRNA (guanine527-N7)-methyltransferase